MNCVVALDVGGTTMKGALLAPDGAALHRQRWPTPAASGAGAVVDAIAAAAVALRDRALAGGDVPLAAGVAVPGQVDDDAGTAVYSANLGWRDVPLRATLTEAVGLPLAFTQDVRAGAIAEARFGAARDVDDFVFLALGTGVGAAVVLGGRVRSGVHSLAGELGHVRLGPGDERCGCGGAGCAEAIASAPAIARRYAAATGTAAERLDAEEVSRRAAAGDAAAQRVWADAIAALAGPLASAIALLDLDAVVVGGGVARADAALLEPLRRQLADRLPIHPAPDVRAAALGDEAGCEGAGALAWDLAGAVAGTCR